MSKEQKAARKASLLKLRAQGLTQQQIADLIGVSRQRVTQLLAEGEDQLDAVVGTPAESEPEVPASQAKARRWRGESRMNMNRKKVAALRESGRTYPEIARELGISVGYAQVLNGSDGRRGGSTKAGVLSDAEHLDREIRWYMSKDLPIRVISLALDVPISTVRYRIGRLGLDKVPTENDTLFAQGKQRCTKCHEIKDLDQYGKNKFGANGYSRVCKTCVRQRYLSWNSKRRRFSEDDGPGF